eukprot:COSAG01_NODE_1271_length_10961_cov_555.935739_6_plen_79_part_00
MPFAFVWPALQRDMRQLICIMRRNVSGTTPIGLSTSFKDKLCPLIKYRIKSNCMLCRCDLGFPATRGDGVFACQVRLA